MFKQNNINIISERYTKARCDERKNRPRDIRDGIKRRGWEINYLLLGHVLGNIGN
jgi:hypothetical protein